MVHTALRSILSKKFQVGLTVLFFIIFPRILYPTPSPHHPTALITILLRTESTSLCHSI